MNGCLNSLPMPVPLPRPDLLIVMLFDGNFIALDSNLETDKTCSVEVDVDPLAHLDAVAHRHEGGG